MSLEQQITALVASSNALTEVVDGKIREIDKRVDKAVTDIPEAIRDESKKKIYLDAINGSDTNDGLHLSRPIKTFKKAGLLVMPGGTAEIWLLNDYTFLPTERSVTFYSSSIVIRSVDRENRVKIKFSDHRADKYPNNYFMVSFQIYHSGVIEFYGINLELPDVPLDHKSGMVYPHGASVIRSNSSGIVATDLNVRLASVEIIVPQAEINEFHFIGNPSAITTLSLSSVTTPSAWRDRNKMFYQGCLSETVVAKRIINSATAMSTDDSVHNSGIVK